MIAYCQQQRPRGEGVRIVATALGVAPWALHRWMRAATSAARFRPVTVTTTATATPPAVRTVSIRITADGPHIDGLDVDSAARLLRLLR